jgi:hypothetical protein
LISIREKFKIIKNFKGCSNTYISVLDIKEDSMTKAKVSKFGKRQALWLPEGFRVDCEKIAVNRLNGDIILFDPKINLPMAYEIIGNVPGSPLARREAWLPLLSEDHQDGDDWSRPSQLNHPEVCGNGPVLALGAPPENANGLLMNSSKSLGVNGDSPLIKKLPPQVRKMLPCPRKIPHQIRKRLPQVRS